MPWVAAVRSPAPLTVCARRWVATLAAVATHGGRDGVTTALQRAVPHLCIRILRDIAMAKHGVELSHCRLPFVPCAHTLSLLYYF